MFRRRPPLPDDLHRAWWSFLDCAEVIEGGRRRLLATLPVARVEPAPVAVGLDAVGHAIDDARSWMDGWKVAELAGTWEACSYGLDAAASAIPEVRRVAAETSELEELLTAVHAVVDPLDAFADAERVWRRRWRVPDHRPG